MLQRRCSNSQGKPTSGSKPVVRTVPAAAFPSKRAGSLPRSKERGPRGPSGKHAQRIQAEDRLPLKAKLLRSPKLRLALPMHRSLSEFLRRKNLAGFHKPVGTVLLPAYLLGMISGIVGAPTIGPATLGAVLGALFAALNRYAARRVWVNPPQPLAVVITGGSKGLGKALARELLQGGDKVLITSRSASSAAETVRQLKEEVGADAQVFGMACDVSDWEDLAALEAAALRHLDGRVDVWVNNAAYSGSYKPFLESDAEDIEQVVRTNLLGTLLATRQAMRLISRQPGQRAGHIFNMEGAGSDGMATPQYAAYGATKSAIAHLNATLQRELRELELQAQEVELDCSSSQPMSAPQPAPSSLSSPSSSSSSQPALGSSLKSLQDPLYASDGPSASAGGEDGLCSISQPSKPSPPLSPWDYLMSALSSALATSEAVGTTTSSRSSSSKHTTTTGPGSSSSSTSSPGCIHSNDGLMSSRARVHTLSPGMILTDLLLEGATSANKQAFNILCEQPETVAAFLVPRIRSVVARDQLSGARIVYLTPWSALGRLATAPMRIGRFFDAEGRPVYPGERERLVGRGAKATERALAAARRPDTGLRLAYSLSITLSVLAVLIDAKVTHG